VPENTLDKNAMPVPLKNDLYLRALNRENTERTPVWVMRQAGRYLPEYLETRKRAGDFMTLCSTPELACEVTLQPLDRFDLDAAILFSDILTIPDAMGLGLRFEAGEGPIFDKPVRTRADIEALPIPDPSDELRYVTDAVSLIRQELDGRVPLIGFSGYLNAQVAAGAQSLMIFDTWGGVLSPAMYREFSLAYMQRIVDGLTREADGKKIPVVLFTKNGGAWLDAMADTGCDGLGVDWTMDLADARRLTRIRDDVKRVLESYGDGPGHVFNLGHGIHQHVNPDHLGVMVDAVKEFSAR